MQNSNSSIEQISANSSDSSKSRRRFLKLAGAGLVGSLFGTYYWPRRWKYIVIHHSAGNYGNIQFLQEVHRRRQAGDPIDAIPYHFIIGNGNGMKMGEIASDWRQENHIWGTHVSANNRDRNFRGLGICMIGNYEANQVPESQYQSLLGLTKNLMAQYSIKLEHVTGHGLTSGESTLCPGRHFPIERLKQDLS